jgi:hypothetical protein
MTDDEKRKREILDEAKELLGNSPAGRIERWKHEAERVRREAANTDEIIYKRKDDALVQPPAAAETTSASDDERVASIITHQAFMDLIGDVVRTLRSEMREADDKREADLRSEISKIWASVVEAHRNVVSLQREKTERVFRDEPIDWSKVKVN